MSVITIIQHLPIFERVFGMTEESLRACIKIWFDDFIDRENYLNNTDPYRLNRTCKQLDTTEEKVAYLYERLYTPLVDAYFLYSRVKRKVDYSKVLKEEFYRNCINYFSSEADGRFFIHSDEYKFRMQIRKGYGDYINKHIDKILKVKEEDSNEMFLHMLTDSFIGSFYQALKNSPDLNTLKTNTKIDVDAVLDEECTRALDIYPKLFMLI